MHYLTLHPTKKEGQKQALRKVNESHVTYIWLVYDYSLDRPSDKQKMAAMVQQQQSVRQRELTNADIAKDKDNRITQHCSNNTEIALYSASQQCTSTSHFLLYLQVASFLCCLSPSFLRFSNRLSKPFNIRAHLLHLMIRAHLVLLTFAPELIAIQ